MLAERRLLPPSVLRPLLLPLAQLTRDLGVELPGEHRDLVVDLDAVGVLDLLDELGRGLALGAETDDELRDALVTDADQLVELVRHPGQVLTHPADVCHDQRSVGLTFRNNISGLKSHIAISL